jgi:hypothetical protein
MQRESRGPKKFNRVHPKDHRLRIIGVPLQQCSNDRWFNSKMFNNKRDDLKFTSRAWLHIQFTMWICIEDIGVEERNTDHLAINWTI